MLLAYQKLKNFIKVTRNRKKKFIFLNDHRNEMTK